MNKRSTLDAVSLLRRYIELVEERQNQALHLVFIDWEKAFDKIHPAAVESVLRRFGVPEGFAGSVASLLASPTFRVDMDGEL
eukprot:13157470-Alexandrium_andersonii.AAC.1